MDFVQHQRAPKNHLPGIGFVIVLHILIIWAMVSGLARKAVEFVAKPLETKLIAEVAKPPDTPPPPPPPPPKMVAPPPPFIPPPEIMVQAPPPPTPAAITSVTSAPPPPGPAPVAAAPVEAPKPPLRTAPVVQAKSCEPPDYPSVSRRLNESGTVMLNFLIDAGGRVVESRIDSSSGVERLDEAARKALSLCKFTPGSVDGKPEQSWHKMKYVWKLDR